MNKLLETQLRDFLGGNFSVSPEWDQIALVSQTYDNFAMHEARLAASQPISVVGSWELEFEGNTSPQLKSVYWSDETFRILGLMPGVDKASAELFQSKAADHERINKAIQETAEHKIPVDLEYCILLPEGTEKFVRGRRISFLIKKGYNQDHRDDTEYH